MKSDEVIVGKSKIHGRGVFAARDFKKGEIVLHWDMTNVLTDDEVKDIPFEDQKYVSYIDGKYRYMQEPERHVNHSCEPNVVSKDWCEVALRDIKKGEEILSDYVEELPSAELMECHCKSDKCRGFIKFISK